MIITAANFVRSGGRIEDAWREVMSLCIANGWDYVVKGGSYEGQIRKQLPFATIVVDSPWIRPLAPIMPPNVPGPTSDDKIIAYFVRYVIGNEVAPNETYTYGQYIFAQIDRVIQILNDAKGNTNQACIAIGEQESIKLSDPPCLRTVSFKVVEKHLIMTVFFRSWDLYTGLPENLGGLQMLKEYVLAHLNFPCEDGSIVAYSDGLHIYEQYFPIVDLLNVQKIVVSQSALDDKDLFL